MNPSRNWSRAMPSGPDARVKITEEYAKHVARDRVLLGVANDLTKAYPEPHKVLLDGGCLLPNVERK